jgi:hypothetical protein
MTIRFACCILALLVLTATGCAGGETVGVATDEDAASVRDTGRVDSGVSDTGSADTASEDTATDTAPDSAADTAADTADTIGGPLACTPATAATVCGDANGCFDGFCCNVACNQGCARCDLPGREGICTPLDAGTTCREASNLCDAAEVCDGLSAACPADRFAGAGTSCGSTDSTLCDAPDSCDGFGNCDANFEPFDTACGGGDGACLLGERCDGFGVCASAGQKPAGTLCGDATSSACDAPDSCNSSGECLPNFAPDTAPCGDPGSSACDAPDRCDGLGGCEDRHVPAGASCGNPDGSECDTPDTCDGEGACLANALPAFTACGDPSSSPCDRRDSCDGAGSCLPRVSPAGVACGSSVATECNAPDVCDGAGGCSAQLAPVGSACGSASASACDAPDSCDLFGRCVANQAPTTTVCRPAASDCDIAEFCDGRGGCGADALQPGGTSCGDRSATECDAADSCDGAGRCLSNPLAAGTSCLVASSPCEGAGSCDGAGSCGGGALLPPGTLCGSSAVSECDNADTCDALGDCQPNHRVVGSSCGALATGPCDGSDLCDGNGECSPNFTAEGASCGSNLSGVCDDADSCDGVGSCDSRPKPSTVVCRDAVSGCDSTERCDGAGSCPNDAFAPAGTACGSATTTACSAADSCDGTGLCSLRDAADGTACGAATTAFRCDGAGCGARAQQQVTTPLCTGGNCAPQTGAWSDLEVCGSEASCTVDGTSAFCDRCDTPPPARCDANRAVNYAAVGACGASGCTYAEVATDCGGGCSVTGGIASCSACGSGFAAVAGAPFWSFETDTAGWALDADWSRSTTYASTGAWGLSYLPDDYDFDSGSYGYSNGASARARWNTDVDASQCGGCNVSLSFKVRGYTESNYDGITVQCRPTAGTWNSVGSLISGSYGSATTVNRSIPSSCLSAATRLGFNFTSDFSLIDEGYTIDAVRISTTPSIPNGYLDNITSTGFGGWSCDPDSWSSTLQILVAYFANGGGTPIYRTVTADQNRPDLVTEGVCGGTALHGYAYNHDPAVLAALGAGTHTIRTYAIDATSCGGLPYELQGSPRTFTR